MPEFSALSSGSPQAGGHFVSALALSSGSPQAGGLSSAHWPYPVRDSEPLWDAALSAAILSEVNDLYFETLGRIPRGVKVSRYGRWFPRGV